MSHHDLTMALYGGIVVYGFSLVFVIGQRIGRRLLWRYMSHTQKQLARLQAIRKLLVRAYATVNEFGAECDENEKQLATALAESINTAGIRRRVLEQNEWEKDTRQKAKNGTRW